jgi:hypothetical protein
MLSRCWYLGLHTSCTTVLYGKLADTEDHAYQLAFPQFGVMQWHQKQTTEHIFQECPLLAEAKQPSPAELCEKGKPQTRKAEKHAGQRCRDVLLAVVFVELAVHRSARLYFNEVMDRPVLRIGTNLLEKDLELSGLGFKRFEFEEPVDQLHAERIPEILVHKQWEREVKKFGHCQMDAEMALVGITHAFIQSRCISRHSALKRRDSGIEMFRELVRVVPVQFSIDHRRNLPDLYRR